MRLALVQMRVEPGLPDRNLARASELVAEAARRGAEVAVLPEACDAGWTDAGAAEVAAPVPGGATCEHFQALAAEHSLFLCTGLTERGPAGEVFNAAVLMSPGGEILLHHRKVYELAIARPAYATGDRLGVVESPWGRVGVMICADAFAPGQPVSRTLGHMGAGVILSPCAWAVAADHDNTADPYGRLWIDSYGPVARDHDLWIAAASNVGPVTSGPWAGKKCIGCSLAVGPDGRKHFQAPYGEEAEGVFLTDIPVEI